MDKPRIVVVGSANTDLTVVSPDLPRPGETVLGSRLVQAGGGKGANQAVAAARAGARVCFVGRVGDDDFGRATLRALAAEGIDTEHVVTDPEAPNGVALIMVDERGENLISVAPGANARLCAADVRRAAPQLESADAVLVQLEIPEGAVACALGLAHAAGATTVLNPAPAPRNPLDAGLLHTVSVLTPNRAEAAALADAGPEAGPEELAAALAARGAGAVVLTLGADGVCVCDPEGCERLPAAPARAVDTVGAGDCFSAVLAVGLAEGMPLRAAARRAICAAALATETPGAQTSMPGRARVEEKLRSVFGV